MILFFALAVVVIGVMLAMKTRWGEKISHIAPTPFWIYFVPILLATFHVLPHESPVYDIVSTHALPAALTLMLIGTPLADLFKLSRKAATAILLASVTMLIAAVVAYILMIKFLPPGSEDTVGALLGTWVGGSANMLAVKEILKMPDSLMAPLIIVDTFLSYSWMAMLVLGAGRQSRYDLWAQATFDEPLTMKADASSTKSFKERIPGYLLVLGAGFIVGEIALVLGQVCGKNWTYLSGRGWTIIIISIVALALAATPLQKLERHGASKVGGFLLYFVLATIGVKTTLAAVGQAPVFILFGGLILVLHGILMLLTGRWKRIPLFLLATGSQAAVGGPVSAPILAEIYRPGTSPIGVLMALLGALVGTYIGLFGAWICHGISRIFL